MESSAFFGNVIYDFPHILFKNAHKGSLERCFKDVITERITNLSDVCKINGLSPSVLNQPMTKEHVFDLYSKGIITRIHIAKALSKYCETFGASDLVHSPFLKNRVEGIVIGIDIEEKSYEDLMDIPIMILREIGTHFGLRDPRVLLFD